MNGFKWLVLLAVGGFWLTITAVTAPKLKAQSCDTPTEAPACPYGYFEAPPYDCAAYGYYGPEWFKSGAFIGVGPWFKGPTDFHGNVDNHFRPDQGYKGTAPKRGEKADPAKPLDKMANFKGNQVVDGQGKVVKSKT